MSTTSSTSGVDWITFRLANVVGPRNVSGPLPIFFDRLSQGKRCFVTEARRDFVFVHDLAGAVVKAADGTGSGTYHFSSGRDVAIKELYDAVVRAMRLNEYPEPEIRPLGPDDAPTILLEPSRTFRDFGEIALHAARRDRGADRRLLSRIRCAGRLHASARCDELMRLLITGGAGCLGSNLVEAYLPRGHEVLVIDNFATGRREVLPERARPDHRRRQCRRPHPDRSQLSSAFGRPTSSTALRRTRTRRTGARTPRATWAARSMSSRRRGAPV